MAIEGPIEELSLTDLLQLLSLARKTGALSVSGRGGEEIGKIYLDEGNVAYASLKGGEGIGERLLKEGRVNQERLRLAQDASKGGRAIGEVLIDLSFVTRSELERFSRLQVEEAVYQLFELKRGYFRFEEGDLSPDAYPLFSLKVESLLMEGSRRIDEWSRISQKIPSLDLVPELALSPEEPSRLDLEPGDWAILALVDGRRSVREIANRMGGEFEKAKQIYDLIAKGVLSLKVAERVEKEAEGPMARGERFLREGLYGKAAEEFELALEENPEDPKILDSLGDALYKNGSYGEALSFYTRLGDLVPERPETHYHLGFCLARLGNLKSAISEWETFVSLSPSEPSKTGIQNMVKLARELENALDKR